MGGRLAALFGQANAGSPECTGQGIARQAEPDGLGACFASCLLLAVFAVSTGVRKGPSFTIL